MFTETCSGSGFRVQGLGLRVEGFRAGFKKGLSLTNEARGV